MKNIFTPLAIIALPITGFCHSNEDSLLQKGYLYNNFVKGSVLFKNGATEEYFLNFNTNTQGIEFLKDGQSLMLTNFSDIDTIYLENKKLVAVDEKFYFLATTTEYPLLVSYFNKPHPLTATVDHNGTSQQSSTSQVSNSPTTNYIQRPFKSDYYLEYRKEFWIKRIHSLYKANSEKQFIKIFPSKANEISAFIKRNSIDFTKEDDVIKLSLFCNFI